MPRDAMTSEPAHFPVLDGVRGLAILLVMMLHLWTMPAQTKLDRVVSYGTNLGWFGVDLFFVLSGYLITGILLDAKGADHYFRNFYARRVLRIFPLYYAILVASLYLLPHLLPPAKLARFGTIAGDEAYYWLYLSNFAMARVGAVRHGVLDVTWSLAIEEQFYPVWPALVFLCSPRALVQIAAGLALGSFALRVGLHFFSSYNAYSIHVLTPCHLDGLVVGAILAAVAREPGGQARGDHRAAAAGDRHPDRRGHLRAAEPDRPGNEPDFHHLRLLAGGGALRRGPDRRRRGGAGLDAPPPVFVAVPAHVRQVLVRRVPRPFATARADPRSDLRPAGAGRALRFPELLGSELPGQLVFYVVAGAASLGVAWDSYQVFEKQFLKLKRFFPSGAAACTTTPDPALDRP